MSANRSLYDYVYPSRKKRKKKAFKCGKKELSLYYVEVIKLMFEGKKKKTVRRQIEKVDVKNVIS